jgi:hypothetical protein
MAGRCQDCLARVHGIGKNGHRLFEHLASHILHDLGEDLDHHGGYEDLWERLPSLPVFQQRGPECSMGRWFGWHDCAAFHDGGWHARLAVYIFIGLQSNWLKPGGDMPNIAPVRVKVDHRTEPPQVGTKAGANPLAHARAVCHNSMHLAVLLLADRRNQNRCRLLVHLHAPIRLWHGLHSQQCKSQAGNARFMAECASGEGWLPHWNQVHMCATNLCVLAECGFITEVPPSLKEQLTLDHTLVLDQDHMAMNMGVLTMALLKHNTNSKLVNFAMWPGKFALLGHPDEKQRDCCLASMQADWQVFREASAFEGRQKWKARLKRCCLKLPLVYDTFVLAERCQFKYRAVLGAIQRACYQGLNFSRLIEDQNQRQRGKEERDRPAKEMSRVKVWRIPVQKKLLSTLYNFKELQIDGVSLNSTERGVSKLPDRCYQRPKKESSLDMAGVVGKAGSAPNWFSPSPQAYYVVAAELELMRHASKHDKWESSWSCWWACALLPGFVYHEVGSDQWWVSLGEVGFTAAVSWPVQVVKHGSLSCYRLQQVSGVDALKLGIVLDPASIEVQPCRWLSPLHLLLEGHPIDMGVCLAAHGDTVSLDKALALKGFAGLQLPTLKAMCKWYSLDIAGSLFDVVHRLSCHILGAGFVDSPEGVEVLETRLHSSGMDFDFRILEESDMQQVLKEDERKEWEAFSLVLL